MVSPEVADAIIILIVGFIAIQGVWLSVLTYQTLGRAIRKGAHGRSAVEEGRTYVEELFLLHRSGTLLRHLTRRLKPYVDSDILSGMLRAVQEFVRDSFKHEEGELNHMTFGELKISIVTGRHAVLATVMRGDPPEDILAQMSEALSDLEQNHGDEIRDWNGVVEDVPFVDRYLNRLLQGEYERDGPPKPAEKPERRRPQLKRLLPLPGRRNSR